MEITDLLPTRKVEHRAGPHQLYVEGVVPEETDRRRLPILFIGGAFDGSWIFRQESEFLAGRGWPVFTMNPRGYYLSRCADVAALTVEDYLQDIRNVQEALGLEPVILAGFSMGGLLALKHAERHGAAALLLYDIDASREVWDATRKNRRPPHVPPVVRFWPSPRIVDEMWGGHVSRRQYLEFLELFKQTGVSGQSYRVTEYGGLPVDTGRIRCPALVIGIHRNEKIQAEYSRRLNASWMIFEGSSHGSILVGPRSFAITQEVARWLENGFATGEKKIFPHLGFLSWDREVYRTRLFYFSGWRHPEAVVRHPRPPQTSGHGTTVRAKFARVGDGRMPGEFLYESTFVMNRRSGFFLQEGGSAGRDHPPGGGLYRPLAREIYLADGEFFPARPPTYPTGPTHQYLEIFSKELNHLFKVHLLIPRNYNTHRQPYPVCILNDGQNQWKNQGAFGGWHTDVITTGLVRRGRCRDVFLVGVESTGLSRAKYYLTPPVGRADLYVHFLVATLLPRLRRDFHLSAKRHETGVVGASYGANCAVYAGMKRPDTFGLVGSLSYAPLRGRPMRSWMKNLRRLPFVRFYADCGTRWTPDRKGRQTDNTPATLDLIRIAQEKGMVQGRNLLGFVARGHAHREPYWRKRIGKCMEFLFPLM